IVSSVSGARRPRSWSSNEGSVYEQQQKHALSPVRSRRGAWQRARPDTRLAAHLLDRRGDAARHSAPLPPADRWRRPAELRDVAPVTAPVAACRLVSADTSCVCLLVPRAELRSVELPITFLPLSRKVVLSIVSPSAPPRSLSIRWLHRPRSPSSRSGRP